MKRTVLFVDDSEDTADLLAECMHRRGFTTFARTSGRDALALLASEAIDVVVTDVTMPGMSGFDLCAALRVLRSELPVLLVTGRDPRSIAGEALRVGAYECLAKPVMLDALALAIGRAFAHLEHLELRRVTHVAEAAPP